MNSLYLLFKSNSITIIDLTFKICTSAILSWFILKSIIPYLSIWFIDKPNNRSSHKTPIPNSGGIVFVAIGILGITISGSNLGLICIPLSLAGAFDDRYGLTSFLRYIIQIITSLLIINNTSLLNLSLPYIPGFIILILLIIFSTAIINFINFMDGIDGLVAGCLITIFGAALFFGYYELTYLIGALIGFLIINWSPAKVFMGDVGSTFLGAVFVGILFESPSQYDFLGFLLIAFPLLADSFICVLRRLVDKQNIFTAHRLHLYQRLVSAGLNHSNVASLYIICSLTLAISFVVGGLIFMVIVSIIELFFGILLDQKVATAFSSN
tara:strand:- start:5656 stop:6630 length:975 start_codon:yes stop_codon:yes gene_type:complete